jgi:outer membrane lipoprotein LolB
LLRRSTFLAFLVLVIAGCAGRGTLTPDPEVQSRWLEQQAVAAAYNQWDMYARAGLRRKGEAHNISIRWQREVDGRFMMMLEAPFGQGVLRIEAIEPGDYRLRLPDGRTFENTSAEALLVDVIGWSLPVSGLEFWVRGLPDARSDYSLRLDSAGRASSINQDGWEIVYLDYFAAAVDPPLPRRLRLDSDDLLLQLVIERWQPATADAVDADLFPSFN